jgi:ABC-type dipeptide/oligopeptide/nickel transport system ATPase component
MIAMALACRPELLIADEPTSALDVTVQVQLLDLIRDIVSERNMALIIISHDLGVVAELADRTLVLYGGAVMEEGPTRALFRTPSNPYTRGLISRRMPGRGERRRLARLYPRVRAAAPSSGAGLPVSWPLQIQRRRLPRHAARAALDRRNAGALS